MWKDRAREVIERLMGWRALHTACAVCTGVLRGPVGSVGIRRRNGVCDGGFSKCPEFHGRVLEKWDGWETRIGSGFGLCFHFSSQNYGYYYLLSLKHMCFFLSVARAMAPPEND